MELKVRDKKKMRKIRKKAVFFSLDSVIALSIIVLAIFLIYPYVSSSRHKSQVQEDFGEVFSTLKIGELNDSYVNNLTTRGYIYDFNQSVLEQLGELYITNKTLARGLADVMLGYLDTSENVGIWYGGNLVASKNKTPYESAKNVEVSTHMISGLSNLEQNGTITGYSARAWLASGMAQKYFYFGGYAGDGNISLLLNYTGQLSAVDMEIAVSRDFDLYINGNFSGHYENSSSEFAPSNYDLSAYNASFHEGENTVKLVADSLYIAGGYFKIIYDGFEGFNPERYYFPGVEGLINIYDGFYVPGQLNTLDILLHMNSSYEMFLTIGNITVYGGNTSGDEIISINNSELSSELDYSKISQKTTPIRLGLKNATYVSLYTRPADAYSVTDISGSMGDCVEYREELRDYCQYDCCRTDETSCRNRNCTAAPSSCNNVSNPCGACSGGRPLALHFNTYQQLDQLCNKTKLDFAKLANNVFIDSILNLTLNRTLNRVGLVAYSTDALDSDYHNLSNDSVSLKNKVAGWGVAGSTCICCGINKAVNKTLTESNPTKFRSLVVMSDGIANRCCSNFNDFTGSSCTEAQAKQNATNSACNAWQAYNITVYSVGFGYDTDNATLQAIANCGNGSYYYSNVSSLVEIYKQIARDILEASYKEQTMESTGSVYTQLYPDSYIEFNYTKSLSPYGLITTLENQFYDSYSGNFSISSDLEVIEAMAVSYSGPRWTNYVGINSQEVYNLSIYGSDYTQLGDPYPIRIPNLLVQEGNNLVNVTTGVSPENITEGSPYNKIIYTVRQNASSYSEIVASASGCNWELEFESGPNVHIKVPSDYTGSDNCYYKASGQNISNDEDAFQLATLGLLQLLDSDHDGKVDVKFTEQNLEISSSKITGVPYIISTDVQIRRWD